MREGWSPRSIPLQSRCWEFQGKRCWRKPFSEVLAQEYVVQIKELLTELKSSQKDSIEKEVTVNLKGKSQTLLINLSNLKDEEGKVDRCRCRLR